MGSGTGGGVGEQLTQNTLISGLGDDGLGEQLTQKSAGDGGGVIGGGGGGL